MISNTGASKLVAVSKIVEHPRNVNEGDVGAIHQSITHNGFYGALVVQASTGHVLVGNHRLRAAKAAGLDRLPVFYVDVDDERALKIMLADNRTGELASRDEQALAALLTEIAAGSGLEGTGYDGDDLDELLGDIARTSADPGAQVDRADELREQWGVESGQVWAAGDHRLVCGDSREAATISMATAGLAVDVLLTDPPYGINIVGRNGTAGNFPGTNAPRTKAQPMLGDDVPFDPAHLIALAPMTIMWGANHYASRLPDSSRWLVWDKKDGAFEASDLGDCELAWTNLPGAARLLHHTWQGMYRAGTGEREARMHPTQKPVALMEWCLDRIAAPLGAVVLDPYVGSGTTIIACEQSSRRGIGIDVDPRYVAVTLQRLHDMGLTPVLQ